MQSVASPRLIKIAAGIALFAIIETLLILYVDRPLLAAIRPWYLAKGAIVEFLKDFTRLGQSEWYLWPCGIISVFTAFLANGKEVPRRYKMLFSYVGARALFLFCAVAASGLATVALKYAVGRARPILLFREGLYDFKPFGHFYPWNSFPSGHTATAVAVALTLDTLYPKARPYWIAFALFVGTSRILVTDHYPSDVLAGALLSFLIFQTVKKPILTLSRKVFSH